MRISKVRNWKDRVLMLLIHLGELLDAIIYILSLSFISSNFGEALVFNDTLDDWVEGR
jgi:hypothetical protein